MCKGVKMMPVFKEKGQEVIKFEDVKVGDRVKLVNENGDTAVVTITSGHDYRLYAFSIVFWEEDGWSVAEILEKPMPNKPGTIMKNNGNKTLYVRVKSHWESVTYGFKYDEETMRLGWNEGNLSVEYAPE